MVSFIKAKTILSKHKTADSWFHIKYSMNLYRGCQHQCIYCDSRSECYRIENFAEILVKENAIELLKKELSRLKEKNTIGTGAMNDPYMPVEKEYELTRKALCVIADSQFPVHIMTKSDLILRDIGLIKEISKTFATVSFTITTAKDELSKIIEPDAPVSSKRFDAIKKFAASNINVGITLMPILPFITDTEENIEEIVLKAKEAGTKYILPAFGMTLRDKQRDFYFEKLKRYLPAAYEKYDKNYKGQYGYSSGKSKQLEKLFYKLCNDLRIETKIPAYIPQKIQMDLF